MELVALEFLCYPRCEIRNVCFQIKSRIQFRSAQPSPSPIPNVHHRYLPEARSLSIINSHLRESKRSLQHVHFWDKSKTPEKIAKLLALLRTPDLSTRSTASAKNTNQPTPEEGLEPTADWTSNVEAHQQPKHHHRLLPVNRLTPEIETKHRAPNLSPPNT